MYFYNLSNSVLSRDLMYSLTSSRMLGITLDGLSPGQKASSRLKTIYYGSQKWTSFVCLQRSELLKRCSSPFRTLWTSAWAYDLLPVVPMLIKPWLPELSYCPSGQDEVSEPTVCQQALFSSADNCQSWVLVRKPGIFLKEGWDWPVMIPVSATENTPS